MTRDKTIRVLVAKPGLDGHDRGAKVIALALRDAGMEVIYSGLHRSVDEIVAIAVQEDVDLIGLSILSGAHLPITQKLLGKMKESGIAHIPLVIGGNIPARDHAKLQALGVAGVFATGSDLDKIAQAVREVASCAPQPTSRGRLDG